MVCSCFSLLAALHVLLFHSAHPLWPGVQRRRSERCVSHQVRQDAHWLLAADRSRCGQSAVGKLTFLLAPWPWWEVKCVAGSSQHWHSRMRRRSERRRRRRRGRKKDQARGREICLASHSCSHPPFSSQLSFGRSHDSLSWPLYTAFHMQRLSSLLLQSQTWTSGTAWDTAQARQSLCVCSCVSVTWGVFFEMVTRPISHRPLLSSQRCLATICPPERDNKNQRMLENALYCSNEYFRHKGPLSQPAFAWLSPPNSPFKVKWWGLS